MKRAFVLRTAAVTAALAAGAAAWIAYLALHDYTEEFRERKGRLAGVRLEGRANEGPGNRYWLTLTSDNGFRAACGLLTPRQTGGRSPAVVLLGGKATGKYAVDFAMGVEDVFIVAPDYPYEPRAEYSLTDLIGDIPAIRRALLDMVPSVMLVLDYLCSRSDVDTTRIVLLGYSFGAPLVPCVIAHDRRPAVGAMVYGAGDLRSLIRHNVRRYEGPLISEFAATAGGILLYPLEPMRYADRIAPVPLLMINGTADEQIPRENVERLFAAAREPKELHWIESRHVNPRNPELTRQIIDTLRARLTAYGFLRDPVRE